MTNKITLNDLKTFKKKIALKIMEISFRINNNENMIKTLFGSGRQSKIYRNIIISLKYNFKLWYTYLMTKIQ
jgi:hypothetical protein